MGIKDKLKSGLRSVWSPITVWMAEEGSDQLVTSGAEAKVVVAVNGEDDGTAERVDVELALTGWGGTEQPVVWPLGQVPPIVGKHELVVMIPTGLPPSCAQYAEYRFKATLHRTKGVGSDAASVVDVIARPQDLFWPDGSRSGTDGDKATWLEINVDVEVVAAGSAVTGQVSAAGAGTAKVVLGALITTSTSPAGKFKEVARVEVAVGTPFTLTLPDVIPPTLSNGAASIGWQIRATLGDTTALRWIGVLDPQGKSGIRDRPSPGLLSWLSSLDSNPGR
jgi:hypothetical protein